jgi:hypothetical protein
MYERVNETCILNSLDFYIYICFALRLKIIVIVLQEFVCKNKLLNVFCFFFFIFDKSIIILPSVPKI